MGASTTQKLGAPVNALPGSVGRAVGPRESKMGAAGKSAHACGSSQGRAAPTSAVASLSDESTDGPSLLALSTEMDASNESSPFTGSAGQASRVSRSSAKAPSEGQESAKVLNRGPRWPKSRNASMRSTVRALSFGSRLLVVVGVFGSACDGTTRLKGLPEAPDAGLGGKDGDGLVGLDGNSAASADTLSPGVDFGKEGATLDSSGGGDSGGTDSGADVAVTVDGSASTVDVGKCDGAALNGVWFRSVDKLTMILAAANGCAISGSVDTASYLHAIVGTYDDATRTMHGTIKRTTRSNGCVTIFTMIFALTDATHFTEAITGTDGRCDLPTTYNEASVWVKQ